MKKRFNREKLKRFEVLIEDLSPILNKNSIKLLEWALKELLVRQRLLVTEYIDYCICPHCYCTLRDDYVAYCDRCGQSLKWQSLKKMKYVSREEIRQRTARDNPKEGTINKTFIAEETIDEHTTVTERIAPLYAKSLTSTKEKEPTHIERIKAILAIFGEHKE